MDEFTEMTLFGAKLFSNDLSVLRGATRDSMCLRLMSTIA
jgi:hypothetical protein